MNYRNLLESGANVSVTIKLDDLKEIFKFQSRLFQKPLARFRNRRSAIKKSEVIQRLSPEHLRYVRQLFGMANNFNQIAKKANTAGYSEACKEWKGRVDLLDSILKIITKLSVVLRCFLNTFFEIIVYQIIMIDFRFHRFEMIILQVNCNLLCININMFLPN